MDHKGFEQFKKSNSVKWIAVFIAIIILFITVSATLGIMLSYIHNNESADTIIATDDNGTPMTEYKIYDMPSTLKFSSEAMTASAGHSVSVTVQATVLPVETENKQVDWSVSWEIGRAHV